ncbi:MAG TPA: NHL repeat-containing protein [Bryobacteraceae bacterium]
MKKNIVAVSGVILCASTLAAQQYTISTIAGGGALPTGIPALSVRLPISGGVAWGADGDLYFSAGNSVMRVDANGILTRFAGTGAYGLSGDGGPALSAQLAWPAGLAFDSSGNLFIADDANHRIRKVTPAGIISTVAGSTAGYSGDGGPATGAQLNWPTAVALDATGNLYIADTSNQVVRKVSAGGVITTFATGLNRPEGLAVDSSGDVYIADYTTVDEDCCCGETVYTGRIVEMPAGGGTMVLTAGPPGLSGPEGMTIDSAGNVYVADAIGDQIWKISAGGVFSVVAGNTLGYQNACPQDYSSSGPFACPADVAVDGAGNVYVADTGHSRIARISPQGDIASVVGDGAPGNYWGDGGKAIDAGIYYPLGVIADNSGNLYVSDSSNSRVRKVAPDGTITTFAGTGVSGYSGDGGPATAAQLKAPAGLAFDASGNLYIADWLDNRIRKVSTDGTISTVAGRGDAVPPLGDGGPATAAALAWPLGVAVDASGNLYIADSGFFLIRKVSPGGIISTVAGSDYYQKGSTDVGDPTGLAVDAAGNVFIATSNTIRKLAPDGTVSTVAGNGNSGTSGDGGPATSATLQGPFAVALDPAGNLYISGGSLSGYPFGSGYVRKIAPNGIITTIAGNGVAGYSGDGGPATGASFSTATAGIAVDGSGTVYVTDVFNSVVRALRPSQ